MAYWVSFHGRLQGDAIMDVRITIEQLAGWLDEQGEDSYWTVDGDPLLGGRLSFPCPSDELAAELRKINKGLLVVPPPEPPSEAGGPTPELDDFVDDKELGTRVLQLRWEDSDSAWILIEDEETSENVLHEMHSE